MSVLRVSIALVLFAASSLNAQERVVFEGVPLREVQAGFDGADSFQLDSEEAFKAQVRIVQHGERFYWASRGMKELVQSRSGAYITYHAVDGSGYIRIGGDLMLNLRDRLPPDQRAREIGYMEHMILGFSSITYFGNRRGAP